MYSQNKGAFFLNFTLESNDVLTRWIKCCSIPVFSTDFSKFSFFLNFETNFHFFNFETVTVYNF